MEEERHSRSFTVQKAHLFAGLVISLSLTLLVTFNRFGFWIWQAMVIDQILSFAGISHRLLILGSLAEGRIVPSILDEVSIGPTFEMPIHHESMPSTTAIALLVLLVSSILIVSLYRKMPPPVKAVWSVISILAILALLWQTLISPVPAHGIHWVTIDWSCSGMINLCLITLIYVPFLFTIKGPLWVKILWLFVAIGFSVVWNILRLSLVTATLYYFGSLPFLLLHYAVGAFIEFVYIVAFYSLGLAHLSKYQASGAIRFGL
jgi:exosortase/archaeosortase family protein